MSDDEVMRFEITDYDIDNEFNHQRGRKPNKEQQIYGVWAKDSDEEDNEDNVRRRVRKPKDFSAPIGFVAGGVQQAGKKKEKEKEQQSKQLMESEPTTSRTKYADSSEEEDPPAPSEGETAGIRRAGQGMRPAHLGGFVGTWERHTKGIGAKLLLKMGFEPGKGLGKDLQGISAPVEATLRKGRGAIGAYGPEKAALKAKEEERKRLKEAEEQEKGTVEKSNKWKKSHKGRYFYKEAADVIQEGKPTTHTMTNNELARVPVIDMTGREKRVLSGYHALRANVPLFEHEPRRKCHNFAAPELMHNLELMLECCEQDIIENARQLHAAEDEIVVLERDLGDCGRAAAHYDGMLHTVTAILQRVQLLGRPHGSLEDAFDIVAELKRNYPLEYEMYSVDAVACTVISPLLSALLAKWDPLTNPEEPLPVFLKWKEVLSEEAFNGLLWQHVIPHIERAAERWNPRCPAPMLAAVKAWEGAETAGRGVETAGRGMETAGRGVVSAGAVRALVPRLHAAVTAWDPTRDTQPIHDWVLPWHDLAGSALSTSVYPLIRSRLSSALGSWHPADGSALGVLGAWRGAWGGALTALLQLHVVPKLDHCLATCPIDLVGGDNSAWSWCVRWSGVLGWAPLAAAAGRSLLPRWLAALAAWLNTAPPHATVLKSYTDFKKMFPDEIMKEPVVRDAFRKALDMMNRSADIDSVEPPPPPRFTITETKETSRIAEVLASSNQTKSFSELLETRCIENGITFVPLPAKFREGRPIYRIGASMQCYVIRNVIMYSNDAGRTFVPISMERLLKMAED